MDTAARAVERAQAVRVFSLFSGTVTLILVCGTSTVFERLTEGLFTAFDFQKKKKNTSHFENRTRAGKPGKSCSCDRGGVRKRCESTRPPAPRSAAISSKRGSCRRPL
jgi:hypothetical protein